MHEAEEVLDVIFISSHQPAEVLQPREQSFDFPSMPIAAQLSSVLGCFADAITFMRRDQVDPLRLHLCVQPITIVSLVANQSPRPPSNKALLHGSLDKGDFMRRSRRCVNGDRNTITVCHCHELRTLAPLGLSDCAAPFLAPTKVPSMKHCDKSNLPRVRRSSASASRIRFSVPVLTQYWKRRWHVWYETKRSGKSCHAAPDRKIHKMPFRTARSSLRGLPRPSTRGFGLESNGSITFHCSSLISSRRAIASPQHELRNTYSLFCKSTIPYVYF